MEDNNKHTENKDLVLEFLQRLSSATYSLSQTNEGDEMMDESSQEDTTHLIDLIARNLLNSCDVTVLSSDISNLPTLTASDPTLQLLEEDGNDDDVDIPEPYKYRRSDYLRKLLRVMAPISMNVAAHVCSSVLTYDSPSMQCQAILLLSHWLPVAPHLAPMVTEFLQLLEDPWKHADKNDLNTQFLVSEACFYLCSFYAKRSEIHSIRNCWDWTFLFDMLQPRDVTMSTHDEPRDDDSESSLKPIAVRWYSARVMGCVLDWKPVVLLSTLKRLGLAERRVPWLIHPWEINKEEADMQNSIFRSRVSLWSSDEFDLPSSEQIQYSLPASNTLANVGPGLTFYKYASLEKMVGAGSAMDNLDSTAPRESPSSQKRLILTPTTCRNLSLLGAVLCQEPHPPPILICGPHGSGKSSLARELLRLCRSDEESLLEFHIDEETDSKTLIGSYTTTDIPGEFSWRAGALTHATREGRWVLIEDLDSVPVEIQAALTKLLEDRLLPLGNGKYERCHPNFRIFGTCTTTSHQQHQRQSLRISANRGGGKRILSPSLWRKVHVKPLPWSELKQIASSLFLNLPESVIDAALSLLQTLDRSGREEMTATGGDDDDETDSNAPDIRAIRLWTGGRNPSVRDFFKVLTRISGGVAFGSNMAYTTEAQRTLCLAECVDIFVGSCPDRVGKLDFVNLIAAPIWSISRDLAISYVETRRPPTLVGADIVEIGRAKIHLGDHIELSRRKSETFAQTNHALRLMESVGVCIRENEPVLLVGETGCGKTTLVQQLAVNCERELIVQNLSLQTDSTDLLGGYKPLEIRNVARKVYNEFVNIFVATFSRKQNAKFLQYASSMMEKSNWKKLSQCFQRASHLGLSQMKDRAKNEALASSKKRISLSRSWDTFSNTVERFEKQRLTCDAGLAFVFAEGVLVDAIQSGKW
jgi:energy-coupling factor transporter ATP-binding protein EcfA2